MSRPNSSDYGEIVNVHIYPSAATLLFCDKKASLELGWTPQQVISSIGQPISVFRKAEDPNPGYTDFKVPCQSIGRRSDVSALLL